MSSDQLFCFALAQRLVKNLASSPFYFDKGQPSRFGIMPRYSTDECAILACATFFPHCMWYACDALQCQ